MLISVISIVNCFNYLPFQLDCQVFEIMWESLLCNYCWIELNHLWLFLLLHLSVKHCQLLLWFVCRICSIIFIPLPFSSFQILIVLLFFANSSLQTEVSSFYLCSSWVHVSLWSTCCFPLPAPGTSWPYYTPMIDWLIDWSVDWLFMFHQTWLMRYYFIINFFHRLNFRM